MFRYYLFKGDHLGGGHQSTSATVLDGLVGDGELAQIETDEVRLDLDIDELLAVVDTDDGADHLREDDGVSQVGLDNLGLLAVGDVRLGLGQLLDESHGTSLDASGELSSVSGVESLNNISSGHIEQLLKLNTSVGELSEGTGLLLLNEIHISHTETKLGQIVIRMWVSQSDVTKGRRIDRFSRWSRNRSFLEIL